MTPLRKYLIAGAAFAAVGGGAIAANLGNASAASSTDSTTTVTTPVDSGTSDSGATDSSTGATDSSQTPAPPDGDHGPRGGQPAGPHAANGITEEVLTGDAATSVEAAVKAAYPDATIERMETDAEGATYEAHITKADGSDVTVKLDASFAISGEVSGHG